MEKRIIPVVFINEQLIKIFSELIDTNNLLKTFKFKLANYSELEKYSKEILISDELAILELEDQKQNYEQIYVIKISDSIKSQGTNETNISTIFAPFKVKDILEQIEKFDFQRDTQNKRKIAFTKFIYDPTTRILSDKEKSIRFTEKEAKIFQCLFSSKENFIMKKDLLEQVWSYSQDIDTHTLETHIYSLRKKIENQLDLQNLINFREKKGYYLNKEIL